MNHLSYLAEMYVDLIFNVDLFFDSIQIKLRRADGRSTQRWVFTRVDNGYEDDDRWELLQRIGRFLGQIRVWGFSQCNPLNILWLMIFFSTVVYNKHADEPVYSVTVIFQW